MCLKYGKSQPKRAYKAHAYKKKECSAHYALTDFHFTRATGNGRSLWKRAVLARRGFFSWHALSEVKLVLSEGWRVRGWRSTWPRTCERRRLPTLVRGLMWNPLVKHQSVSQNVQAETSKRKSKPQSVRQNVKNVQNVNVQKVKNVQMSKTFKLSKMSKMAIMLIIEKGGRGNFNKSNRKSTKNETSFIATNSKSYQNNENINKSQSKAGTGRTMGPND